MTSGTVIRHRVPAKPKIVKSGDILCRVPLRLLKALDEKAVTIAFIKDMKLFGGVFSRLCSDYFWSMPRGSGVFIGLFVPTLPLCGKNIKPGDVDILVLPYEGDEIILSHIMAIEVKVLRATFLNQNKSPNKFGFSQAEGLLGMGFPFAAVLHLITSDESPRETWEKVFAARIIDDYGNAEELPPQIVDMMPSRLTYRAFNRLVAVRKVAEIGIAAQYIDLSQMYGGDGRARWEPDGSDAAFNERYSFDLLMNIVNYFEKNVNSFLNFPKYK